VGFALTPLPLTNGSIYAAGETGFLKGRTFMPNHIIVSRSRDNGRTWTANVAFTAPPGRSLAFIFPALAVDPVNGNLYAVWSDGHTVSVASSTDEGTSWTSPVAVSSAPANTAVLPWVAASNGVVNVVYYGTSAASRLDSNANWFVYFAQSTGSGFTQTAVNAASNHHGVICTGGTGCRPDVAPFLPLEAKSKCGAWLPAFRRRLGPERRCSVVAAGSSPAARGRSVAAGADGAIVAIPHVGGLHHGYERRAA
jgi:hypothetical protein